MLVSAPAGIPAAVGARGRIYLSHLDILVLALIAVAAARILYISLTPPLSSSSAVSVLLAGAACVAIAKYTELRAFHPTVVALLYSAGLVLISFSGAAASAALVFYTGRHFPLVDDSLQAIDAWLGFDWIAYTAWFDQRPDLAAIARVAYQSIFWQPFIVVICLAHRHADRLYMFIAAMVVTLTLTSLIALFLPCLGPYAVLNVSPADHPNVPLVTEGKYLATLQWLRTAAFDTPFPSNQNSGLISFPSYHSTVAVLCIWACWRTLVVKWFALALNLAMLVATPVHGSHYLIDVVAGIVLALMVIVVARPVLKRARFSRRVTESRTGLALGMPAGSKSCQTILT